MRDGTGWWRTTSLPARWILLGKIIKTFWTCIAHQVPAFLNVTDIAGLVKGASEGQGLGNAFLSHIRVSSYFCRRNDAVSSLRDCIFLYQACDAMFHLCRTFEDPDITHVEGDVSACQILGSLFKSYLKTT